MYVTLDKSLNFFGGKSLKDTFDTPYLGPCDPSVVNLLRPLNLMPSQMSNQILFIFKAIWLFFSNLGVPLVLFKIKFWLIYNINADMPNFLLVIIVQKGDAPTIYIE